MHFFHYADLSRDLQGQIARLADILNLPVSPRAFGDLTEANICSSMRKMVEISETRIHETSPVRDQAAFFASGTSNKWEGRMTDDDIARYEETVAHLSCRRGMPHG